MSKSRSEERNKKRKTPARATFSRHPKRLAQQLKPDKTAEGTNLVLPGSAGSAQIVDRGIGIPFPIAGIGASAGGFDAFLELLHRFFVTSSTGMAVPRAEKSFEATGFIPPRETCR